MSRSHALHAARAAALLLVFAATAVQAAEEWRYRVRPGDTLWDFARKYLRSDISPQRLQSHNRISDPLRLPPGSTVSIPVPWLKYQPRQAEVVAVSGAAQASQKGDFSDSQSAAPGLQLRAGAALRTQAGASLMLQFGDGSRLQVHGDSELHLDRLNGYSDTGMFDTRVRLPRGRISSIVQPRRGAASGYVIQTPGMMSSVRGTEFRTASDGTSTLAEVTEGTVAAAGGGVQVAVKAGLGTATGRDGRPMRPIPLLPAPDLSALPAAIGRIPSTLDWPDVQGAAAYRLQASEHADFRTLLQDVRVTASNGALQAAHEGELFLRVRAIDVHGLEGLDADRRVTVAAQPAPPFVIAPAEGGNAIGPRPRLRWTVADQPGLRYRLQLIEAGGDFATPRVALDDVRGGETRTGTDLAPGAYVWRIGAIDANGKQGAWSDPIPFTLHAPAATDVAAAAGADGGLQVGWPKGADGQRYRFQLASSRGFERPTIDRMLDDNRLTLPRLGFGTWYLRVRAVDEDGYEHPYGETQVIKQGCLPCRVLAGAGVLLVLLSL